MLKGIVQPKIKSYAFFTHPHDLQHVLRTPSAFTTQTRYLDYFREDINVVVYIKVHKSTKDIVKLVHLIIVVQ